MKLQLFCCNCGEQFIPVDVSQRFCCASCKDATVAKLYAKFPTHLRHQRFAICQECDVKFALTTRYIRKYCSEECRGRAMRRRWRRLNGDFGTLSRAQQAQDAKDRTKAVLDALLLAKTP